MEGGVRHHPPRRRRGRGSGRARRPRLLVRGRRLRPRPRGAPADRGRVGEGGDLGPARRGRRGLGVDREPVHGLPGFRRAPVPGVLRGVLRRPLPGAARRFVRHAPARRLPAVPQLGPPRTPAALRRSQDRAMKTALGDIEIVSRLGADERTLAFDVLDGLTRPFKEIPPKHFYDTEGSRLFEAITQAARVLPDAHRARDPRGQRRARWSRRRRRPSWSSSAAACRPRRCCCWTRCATPGRWTATCRSTSPRSCCARARRCSSSATRACASSAWWATSSATSTRCPQAEGPRVIVFLGGTIGNFPPGSRRQASCARSAGALRPQDRLLLGTDLVKDPAVLEAAYNDSRGRHRGVQPQHAGGHQPRAGRRLRPRRLRARRVLRPRAGVDRDAPARAAAAWTSTCASSA